MVETMKSFTWGRVIDEFIYDFDGDVMNVVKYHPWIDRSKQANKDIIEYHCEEISQSAESILPLVIAWIAHRKLGSNQQALVIGICRMLKLEE